MAAYYNEIDAFAAQWLRNLIAAGHIAPGDVDERSIVDVHPSDLAGYTQCHFFAGIGVWSAALRLAGWPDDRPVWTGSCPCQPFSAAGKGGGFADERHLWPYWHHLIRVCRPGTVFGEQVASKDGLAWLDLVHADLEGEDYAFWPVDLCAAGVGAPHIRQRLGLVAASTKVDACASGLSLREPAALFRTGWREEGRTAQQSGGASGWLEHTNCPKPAALTGDACEVRGVSEAQREPEHGSAVHVRGSRTVRLADRNEVQRRRKSDHDRFVDREAGGRDQVDGEPAGSSEVCELGHAARRGRRVGGSPLVEGDVRHADRPSDRPGRLVHTYGGESGKAGSLQSGGEYGLVAEDGGAGHRHIRPGQDDCPWDAADWLFCRDGKWRPVEPGTFPLAHGATSRVGRLRAYGNAIVRQWAATIIATYLESEAEDHADPVELARLELEDLLG